MNPLPPPPEVADLDLDDGIELVLIDVGDDAPASALSCSNTKLVVDVRLNIVDACRRR